MANWWEKDAVAPAAPPAQPAPEAWWQNDTQTGPAPAPSASPRAGVPGAPLTLAGTAHDGDTFKLTDGRNARLYGADAFELSQQGRSPSGAPMMLGQDARAALLSFVKPDAVASPTGAMTYGRLVASLTADGQDAGESIIRQGLALAAPEYLKGNQGALGRYMEAERLARQNLLGAHGNTSQTPGSYRKGNPDPWQAAQPGTAGNSQAVFWDEPTPFQGLRP